MSKTNNILLKTDSYKASHWVQYLPKTEFVWSYFESRGGAFDETVFFGLQYILDTHFKNPITQDDVDEARDFWTAHGLTFNHAGWSRLVEKHGGRLPVEIRAVPEGTVVPTGNVLMTVVNTDPEFYWLTNYLETLLVQTWYPSTVATQSREMKKILMKYLDKTGDPAGIDFKLHDFGFRGVSSYEQAAIGGAAHLLNFLGTDNVAGIIMLQEHYGAEMPGFSIPASEHSTITAWGREDEYKAFENMLDQHPTGLVACVSDSFDIYKACRAWSCEPLKSKIMNREGTLVVRPDSGHPPEVVVNVLNLLAEGFGTTTNDKGYKVLPDQLRIIQGDGIDRLMLKKILHAMERVGYSADNIAFGSGGGLLQQVNRDTSKYAFKCSSVTVKGEERDVYKDPITDPGKVSKKGKLKLIKNEDGTYETVRADNLHYSMDKNELVTYYKNGKQRRVSFGAIKERAAL